MFYSEKKKSAFYGVLLHRLPAGLHNNKGGKTVVTEAKLSLKVNAHAQLVATLVEVLAVNNCIEGEGNARAKCAYKGKANHVLVVDASLRVVIVKHIKRCDKQKVGVKKVISRKRLQPVLTLICVSSSIR